MSEEFADQYAAILRQIADGCDAGVDHDRVFACSILALFERTARIDRDGDKVFEALNEIAERPEK